MTEFIGLAYFAEIPVTIINVQRGGPSTGMPTRTQQADLLSCGYASHGDTKHVLLFPEDPAEAFEFAATAFDLAERKRDVRRKQLAHGLGRSCMSYVGSTYSLWKQLQKIELYVLTRPKAK